MATFKSYISEESLQEDEEAVVHVDPAGQDENSNDAVEINIAIAGKAGSGRSNFVNVITRRDENDKHKARPGTKASFKSKEPTAYSNPDYPNVKFSIVPTLSAFETYMEKIDVFLIFTNGEFSDDHVLFAKEVLSRSMPIFFVRTKIYDDNQNPEKEDKLEEIRSNLSKNLEELDGEECKIFLISSDYPEKSEFRKLRDAIAESLPTSKQQRFMEVPDIEELIALERFQKFMEEAEEKEKDVTKFFPSAEEVKQLFVKSGITGVRRKMKSELNAWKKVKINLAIIGNSGVGKSSFINAIRGVDDNAKEAAKIGIVEETKVPASFEHPKNPQICFWDLPGIGTPIFPDIKTLCERAGLEKFDTFLIISAARFTENDLKLAQKIKSMPRKPSFFFVRSKIDIDFGNEKRRLKREMNEESFLKTIRADCLKNLKQVGFTEKDVFLIGSPYPTKWDFDRLGKAIMDHLPSKQKESLTFSMRTHSEDILKEKISILKGRVWLVSAASVASKFGLGPYSLVVDGKLIRKKVNFYFSQLFSEIEFEEFKKLPEDLQQRVEKFDPKPDKDLVEWLKLFDPDNRYNIRMVKKMVVTNKPFAFVNGLLRMILDEMQDTALAILKWVAEENIQEEEEDEEYGEECGAEGSAKGSAEDGAEGGANDAESSQS